MNSKRKRRSFGALSIRTRLVILLLVFTVVPVVATGSIAAPIGTQNARSQIQSTLKALTSLQETQLKSWVEDIQRQLEAEWERERQTRVMLKLLTSPRESQEFQLAYQEQLSLFLNTLAFRGVFDELFILDENGEVILSTNASQEGTILKTKDFFRKGLTGRYLQPPEYEAALNRVTVIVVRPILSQEFLTVGVLAGRSNLTRLSEALFQRAQFGETGETYLVGSDQSLLTAVRTAGYPVGTSYINSFGAAQAIRVQQSGIGEYNNYAGVPVFGSYRWMQELHVALIAEQSQAEVLGTVRATTNASIAAVVLAILLAIPAALLLGNNLSLPLMNLAKTAQEISAGNLALRVQSERRDEIGILSRAFDSMTMRLNDLIQGLEQRVEERTQQLRTRSDQLIAAAEVGRAVATILNTDVLIQKVVDLIRERFNLYYVGLFLVDENQEWAVLRAGTGEAGQRMLARGHRLRIGEGSMIGWSIAHDQARIALEALTDPVRLATSELPDTRSEAAIPLRSRGRVLGAITIQSAQPGAFDQETILVFQTMADQVAIALDNARLFAETQEALEATQQAYGELSRQAWLKRLRTRALGYRKDERGLTPAEVSVPKKNGDASLTIPIRARGHIVGYVSAQKPEPPSAEQPWKPEEVKLMEALVDQLGIALESARLFEETQQRAEFDRLVGEITSRVRSTLELETVLQTAADEIRTALELEEVEVRLGTEDQEPS